VGLLLHEEESQSNKKPHRAKIILGYTKKASCWYICQRDGEPFIRASTICLLILFSHHSSSPMARESYTDGLSEESGPSSLTILHTPFKG
jgi:hypothetical protein